MNNRCRPKKYILSPSTKCTFISANQGNLKYRVLADNSGYPAAHFMPGINNISPLIITEPHDESSRWQQ